MAGTTMRAVRFHDYGPPEALAREEAELPELVRDVVRDVDAVIDTVGDVAERSLPVLKKGGILAELRAPG